MIHNGTIGHNLALNVQDLFQKILLTLILGEKHGFKITWKIIPSLSIQYKWKMMQTGHWDSVEGDHGCLIEVTD